MLMRFLIRLLEWMDREVRYVDVLAVARAVRDDRDEGAPAEPAWMTAARAKCIAHLGVRYVKHPDHPKVAAPPIETPAFLKPRQRPLLMRVGRR